MIVSYTQAAKKDEIAKDLKRSSQTAEDKFTSVTVENFQQKTYGLKTLAEMRAITQEIADIKEEEIQRKIKNPFELEDVKKVVKKKKKKKKKVVLSFDVEDDIDAEVEVKKASHLATVISLQSSRYSLSPPPLPWCSTVRVEMCACVWACGRACISYKLSRPCVCIRVYAACSRSRLCVRAVIMSRCRPKS